MNVQIEESWKKRLQPEFDKDYFKALTDFVRTEYQNGSVYPPGCASCSTPYSPSSRTPIMAQDRHMAFASL